MNEGFRWRTAILLGAFCAIMIAVTSGLLGGSIAALVGGFVGGNAHRRGDWGRQGKIALFFGLFATGIYFSVDGILSGELGIFSRFTRATVSVAESPVAFYFWLGVWLTATISFIRPLIMALRMPYNESNTDRPD